MNPTITIKPIPCLRVEIPVADFKARQALAADLQEQVRTGYLLRAFAISGAVLCDASNHADAEGAAVFAEAWLQARATKKAA